MFFVFATLTLIGISGMVVTHTANQTDALPAVPADDDDLAGFALDENTNGIIYRPSSTHRNRFVAAVDILIHTHHDSELDSNYAKGALLKQENNFIIYMTRLRNNIRVISGFAVGNISVIEGGIYVYIDVLLADRGSGVTTLLPLLRLQFENLRRVVASSANFVAFYLLSIPNRVAWYETNGFVHIPEHDRDGLIFMGLILYANTLQIGNH